jgi:hypothetical protein
VAALAWIVAHGGLAGTLVESLVFVAVAGVFLAVWLRERRGSRGEKRDARTRE